MSRTSPARDLVRLLDRLDAAALPGAVRVIDVVRARTVGLADREVGRARRIGTRFRTSRPGRAGDDPPALLESVGVAPGGVVDRGARVLVLGLVVVIVVSAAAAILQGIDHNQAPGTRAPAGPGRGGPAPAPAPALPAVTIGPGPHDSVTEYLGASRQSLDALTADAPAADLYAVVSLTADHTPADLAALLKDYRVVEVFFTVGTGGEQEQAAIRDPVADVRAAYASAAAQADALASASAGAGDDAARDRATRAAADLRAGCACLFGAVVRAPAGRLSGLATDPGVRVVDPAPPGSGPPAVRFVPLSPDRR